MAAISVLYRVVIFARLVSLEAGGYQCHNYFKPTQAQMVAGAFYDLASQAANPKEPRPETRRTF